MKHPFLATPSKVKSILQKHQFHFKKSLGQNFLVDLNILENIVKEAEVTKDTNVIEIGPGIGVLTEQLARFGNEVLAFEIDERLIPILEDTLQDYNNISIVQNDILKVDLAEEIKNYFQDDRNIRIVANLPYYITTPILFKLLEYHHLLTSITIMLQQEVARRITAKPNTKDYGSLSIAVQYYTIPEIVMDVPKTVFIPQPNVHSNVLHLKMRKTPPVKLKDETSFFEIVRASFMNRRKTILNNLSTFFKNKLSKDEVRHILLENDFAPERRAESFSIEEFSKIANSFYVKDTKLF